MSELEECKVAATKLGRTYYGAFNNLTRRPAGCYYIEHFKGFTIFNLADPSDTVNILPDGGGVCKKGISDNLYCVLYNTPIVCIYNI